jgi:hypothetical protein
MPTGEKDGQRGRNTIRGKELGANRKGKYRGNMAEFTRAAATLSRKIVNATRSAE